MKVLIAVLILSFFIIGTVSAAAGGTALQPVRTAPVVTTTTTAVPVLTITRVTIAAPQPSYMTCTAPSVCISEQDAIAKWGTGNFVKTSDQSCGPQAAATGSLAQLYCYRQVRQSSGPTNQDRYLENSRFALDKPPAVPEKTATTATELVAYKPPFTCTDPSHCITELDAIEEWGQGNFVKDSETPCGNITKAGTIGKPQTMYCYRQNQPVPLSIASAGVATAHVPAGSPAAFQCETT